MTQHYIAGGTELLLSLVFLFIGTTEYGDSKSGCYFMASVFGIMAFAVLIY